MGQKNEQSEKQKKPSVTKAKNSSVKITAKKAYNIEKDKNSETAEPAIKYSNQNTFDRIILFGASEKPESHLTPFEKIELINEGISKKDLVHLKEKSGLDYDQLAIALSVARATLINKKTVEKFDKRLSEKIVGLADIYSYGYEVFEDEEKFNSWIFRPNQALGGKAPYDFLDNQFGREEVRNLIGRIDYGVYS